MRYVGPAAAPKPMPAVTVATTTMFAHTDPDAVGVQWDRVGDTLAVTEGDDL